MNKAWKSKLLLQLSKLGRSNGTAPPTVVIPRGTNDKDGYKLKHDTLCEYIRCDAIRSVINKEYDNVKKQCIELGVFGDIEKMKAGDVKITYNESQATVVVKVNNAASLVNEQLLRIELLKELSEAKMLKIMAKVKVPSAPPKIIIATLKDIE